MGNLAIKYDIRLSSKDKIKEMVLPTELSEDLAYITGVLAGDGNIFIRKHKNDYRVKCVGNPKDEKEFYQSILKPLFKKIFNLDIDVKLQDSGTTYGFYIYSKTLVKFFTNVLELPLGRKYNKLRIPDILKKGKLVNHFIRGLADTDFCIRFKRETYPSIVGCSDSRHFMKEISEQLKKQGFKVFELFDYKIKDSRFKRGFSVINRIELNGRKNFNLWIEKIGFSSQKHLKKIRK
ncbi:hypothetical protein KY345_03935 [Candidatus Woesearchaeota archaeon]|nr:hypothetical protein [Candidatus Woesearchaeota archaeon]